jgi:D-3-phosphoglycerate dehydrogenase / 2-oxoglutarate reductase
MNLPTANGKKVLIAAKVHDVLKYGLQELGYTLVIDEKADQQLATNMAGQYAGVVTSTRLNIDKAFLDAATQLEWVGRLGSGMEIIDVGYAAEKGVKCLSSPEGNCNAVGEHALGMLLALLRKIVSSGGELRNGVWLREENRGWELDGRTVGIVGFGHTGRAFAKKLSGFDVKVLAYDTAAVGVTGMGHVERSSLEQLQERADVLSFHVPLQRDTHHYFDNAFCAAMRKPFILVNTSRGPVVETGAVLEGLSDGRIVGACLDVFEVEPPFSATAYSESAKLLFSHPKVVATPHIAGYTHEAVYKMSRILLEKLKDHLN